MIQPRWKKVFKDLWSYKMRSLLVILSIAIGVFAVGTMVGTQILLSQELDNAYQKTSPSHALIFTDDYTSGFLQKINDMEEVATVDGRKQETVLLHLPEGEPVRMNLFARSDYEAMQLHTLTPIAGEWPPTDHTIIIEQASLPYTQAQIGDVIRIETANGQLWNLKISGTAHDLFAEPVIFTEEPNAYISRETMASLGYGYGLDELFVRVGGNNVTKTQIETVTDQIQFKLGNSGRIPYFAEIFEPDIHPATKDVEPMIFLLGFMALLALFTSCFLIINTTTALITQQTKQIGIMKAYSATQAQISRMYLTYITLFGLLSLLIALPLATLATYGLTSFMATLINFEISGFQILPLVIIVQVIMSLLVPLAAALFPIRRGVKISVKEAIAHYGLAQQKQRWFDTVVKRFSQIFLRGSRPMQIAFRNAVRRKGRLMLTLLTLTFGTAVFISVMSVHTSLMGALDEALTYFSFDDQLHFATDVPAAEVTKLAQSIPEVVHVESWIEADAQRLSNGRAGIVFSLLGIDSNPQTIQPKIVEGRWLLPDDTNTIVLDALVRNREENISIGDTITLKVDGLPSEWQIIGFSQSVLTEDGIGYVNRQYLEQKIGMVGQATGVTVIGKDHSPAAQLTLDQALRKQFKEAGFLVAATNMTADIEDGIQFEFLLIIGMLVVMAVLFSLIGGLGLMGTMSINVLERTGEIGVMRALGASSRAVRRIVMVEGLAICLLSWLLGALLAVPLGRMMSALVGNEILESPLSYQFAIDWVFYWLFLLSGLTFLATFWPARKASRLSIRETLAYE